MRVENVTTRDAVDLDADLQDPKFEMIRNYLQVNWIVNNSFSRLGEVVVAQLVERSLPIPEVRGSDPVIGKKLLISNICILSTVYWKDENKGKEAGNGPFF